MKNIIKTNLILILLLFVGVSCDINPEYYSEVAPDTFYNSKEAVLQRFARPFTHARWTFAQDNNPFTVQELTADAFCSPIRGSQNADKSSDLYRVHYHDFPVHFGTSYQVYISRMSGVARCWATIDDLTYVDLDKFGILKEQWNNWKAQLTSLAALFYLDAFDMFGGLPLYSESATEEKPRSSEKETFHFIENLFLESLNNLDINSKNGYISQAVAVMGLIRLYFNAEVYIGEEMYSKAAHYCQELLDGKYGTYTLEQDWTQIFGFNNHLSTEVIWSIPSERAQLETDAYNIWKLQMPVNMNQYFGGIVNSSGVNKICLTPSLDGNGNPYTFKLGRPFAKFEDTDIRKKKYRYLGNGKYEGMFIFGTLTNPLNPSWAVTGTQECKGTVLELVDQVARLSEGKTVSDMNSGEENSGIRLVKYSPRPDVNAVNLLFNSDIPLMRLAEVYYTLAECKLRAGDKDEAATLINTVRRRYFVDGDDPNPVSSLNLDKWRMLDEWLIEFLGEGRRRTDLIRWNEFIEGEWWDKKPDGSKNQYKKLLPISDHILDASDVIEQNPGYNTATF